jgi:hypothetical protein
MTFYVVDDRDGRVAAELHSRDEALRVLEAISREDGHLPAYLCIVEFDDRPGAILGTESSVTMRPLAR